MLTLLTTGKQVYTGMYPCNCSGVQDDWRMNFKTAIDVAMTINEAFAIEFNNNVNQGFPDKGLFMI